MYPSLIKNCKQRPTYPEDVPGVARRNPLFVLLHRVRSCTARHDNSWAQ